MRFALIFTLVFLSIVLATRTFLDITLPVADPSNFFSVYAASRIYLPLLPLLLLAALMAADTVGMSVSRNGASIAVWCLLLGLGSCALVPWTDGRITGSFPRPAFREARTLAALRDLPDAALVASGGPSDAWLAARRPIVRFPSPTAWFTGEQNPDYSQQLADTDRLLCEHGGVIVARHLALPPFARYAKLSRLATYSDGALYQVLNLRDRPERCRTVSFRRSR